MHHRTSQRGLARAAAAVVLALLAGVLWLRPAHSASTNVYVDCTAGSDTADGTSPATAWHTLARANQASLAVGRGLLLLRGCTFQGPLDVPWSGVTVSSYGVSTDPLPIVQVGGDDGNVYVVSVTGSQDVIDGLYVRAPRAPALVPSPDPNAGNAQLAPSVRGVGCPGTGYGTSATPYRIGVGLLGTGDALVNARVSDAVDGVQIVGSGARVLNNEIFNINQDGTLTVGGYDDWGAQAIEVNGPNAEIANNYLHDNIVCDYDWGQDGSHVAFWGGDASQHADNAWVHDNRAEHSINFAEFGTVDGSTASDVFAFNVNVGASLSVIGANTPGMTGARWYNNTTYSTDQSSGGFSGSMPGMVIQNNLVLTNAAQLWVDASQVTEDHNLFYSGPGYVCAVYNANAAVPTCSKTPAATDIWAEPQFLAAGSFKALGTSFGLKSTSPALGAGILVAVPPRQPLTAALGDEVDTVASSVDIGAVQQSATAPATPTPTVVATSTPAASATPTSTATVTPTSTATPKPTSTLVPSPTSNPIPCAIRTIQFGKDVLVQKPASFCKPD